jgi:hypothetical protein
VLPVDLESAKLFIQPRGLNGGVPLGMMKEVNFPSGYKGLVELTNRYAKLAGVGIQTKVDTSIGEVNMMGSNHVMNGNDKSIGKVNLMKASESQGVDNNLDEEKLTCLNNQNIMTIHSVVAN